MEASIGHRAAEICTAEIIVQHVCARMVYPIDLPREAHALPYNGCTDNRQNSETEIYDTTMSMLSGCPL